MLSRAEHLQWAKDRALEYVAAGDLTDASASLLSDLRKHPGINTETVEMLWAMEVMSGRLKTAHQVTDFINGVN